jgi:hypothetical protein
VVRSTDGVSAAQDSRNEHRSTECGMRVRF